MRQEIAISTICIIYCSSIDPCGTVTLKSSLGELQARFTPEECQAIIKMADAAAVRAVKETLVTLTPIAEAGTLQLVLEHVPAQPPEPALSQLPQPSTGSFDDDIPF